MRKSTARSIYIYIEYHHSYYTRTLSIGHCMIIPADQQWASPAGLDGTAGREVYGL